MTNADDALMRDFRDGSCRCAYEYFGCFEQYSDEEYIYTFRVLAPGADSVYVVGDFNGFTAGEPMVRITDDGVYEYKLKSKVSLAGTFYKYRISTKNGVFLKADPYARFSETRERTASIIYSPDQFSWNDGKWLDRRAKSFNKDGDKSEFFGVPLNIYEVHLGSWKKVEGSNFGGTSSVGFRQTADELAPYVRQMGYTHVELLPIAEHPFDGSWGYQVTGFYAPTSRFGTPADFKYFVGKMHEYGIGVILDWVPAHFAKDEHGLIEFDGSPLYESDDQATREHRMWGTRYFDVSKGIVSSFLISNALYWLKEFHIDGLRVDAVSSMLYIDFERGDDKCASDLSGDRINRAAATFFKKLNSAVKDEFSDVIMIAEESGNYPMVTAPVSEGGLGFDLKWNMGWANDSFEYIRTDPFFRRHIHEKLTFPMMYAYDEKFILPVSHDEVVHGKKSLLDKNFGDYRMKFAGFRLFLAYMMTYPGKKLMFMGCEYAPFREWTHSDQLEWFMLGYDMHKRSQLYTAALNRFYSEHSQLWELDFSRYGFEWIYPDMRELNIIAYKRKDKSGNELIVLLNFSPVLREGFVVDGLTHGCYRAIFSSDSVEFGGSGCINTERIYKGVSQNGKISVKLDLPGMSAVILEPMNLKLQDV